MIPGKQALKLLIKKIFHYTHGDVKSYVYFAVFFSHLLVAHIGALDKTKIAIQKEYAHKVFSTKLVSIV